MGIGRFACVALPFGLTVASLICIMVAMLAGITNHDLSMFDVDTKNFSISANSLKNFVDVAKRDPLLAHPSDLITAAQGPSSSIEDYIQSRTNITAKVLGLADTYKVSLWNYCGTYSDGKTNCTKAKFDWASSATNVSDLEANAEYFTPGANVTLPKEMKGALKTFSVVTKWTEVVYIIAIILAAVELILGVFAICSRVGSCVTWIIAGLATTAVAIASIMATVESSIVVGALKTTANAYGVKAHLNTSFLATTWLAVAFSLAAGLFWSFSMCCCAADHHKSNRKSLGDHEKLIPTGQYQRVGEPHGQPYGQQRIGVFNTGGVPAPQRGHNGAYEPYSHTNI